MKIEHITVYFTIFTSSIITFGLTYNIYLYNKFNIEITSYIDIGESLLLFLPSLPSILWVTIPGVMGINVLLPYSIKNEPIDKHFFYGRLFVGDLQRKKVIIWMFLVFVTIALTLFILSDFYNYVLAAGGYALLIGYLALFFPLLLRRCYEYVVRRNLSLPVILPIITYIISFILISTFYATHRKEVIILEGWRNPSAQVALKDKTEIKTNNVIRYIGKTKNYLFLFDNSNKMSTVIPMSEVQELRFTTRINSPYNQ